jgi:4-hydroxy-tetrahydrodipicolinate synthase
LNKKKFNKNKNKLHGIIPMIYCFFNKNNSIDQKLMIDQINIISKIKSNGIACLGLGTEVNKLTFNEKINIIELVTKYKNIHSPFVITIGGKNYHEQRKLIEIAINNNVNWIIIQPPNLKKLDRKKCLSFFDSLIQLVNKNIHVGIQNAPEYLNVSITNNDILKLYNKYNNFRYIKGESSPLSLNEAIKFYPKNLNVFNGRCGLEIIDNLEIGCKGIIPSLEFSDKLINIYKNYNKKKITLANKQYQKIQSDILFVIQSIETLICYGKRICSYRMGVNKIYDRKPYLVPTQFGITKSKMIAKKLGLF